MDTANNVDTGRNANPKDWRTLRDSIPALRGQVYLNTGVSGPPPAFAIDEEIGWTKRLGETGPGRPDVFEEMFAEIERVRATIADFLGAGTDEIALTQSCSDGMALVAAGLSWKAGDEVLISEFEHISGLLPWYDLQRKYGIIVRSIPVNNGVMRVDDVAAAMTHRTKLICMSHVSYNTGAKLPVADVAQLARDRGVWMLVDGAQGPGHIPVNVKELGCHFYSCAGQKWMLGPDGTGALYVDEEALDSVEVSLLGWASVVYDDRPPKHFSLHPSARRFEVAGKHVPSLAALRRSVEALRSVGSAAIEDRIQTLVGTLRASLERVPGVELITPGDPALWSGLVVFRIDGVDVEEAVQALWDRWRIVCRWIPSPRALRVSVHVFNTEEELDTLVGAVAELARDRS